MPVVNGKRYSYSGSGMSAAKKAPEKRQENDDDQAEEKY